mmetsp:Transcript_34015/g.109199  ORF Transcript_34015/g.109199 Transcript_34015/m.109199 type:complete len:238 (-) Transcript_34015:471-1184(-)
MGGVGGDGRLDVLDGAGAVGGCRLGAVDGGGVVVIPGRQGGVGVGGAPRPGLVCDLLLGGEDADEEPSTSFDGQALVLERIARKDDRRAEVRLGVEAGFEDPREEAGAAADEVALGLGNQQEQGRPLLPSVGVLLEAPLPLRVVDDDEGPRHDELQSHARQLVADAGRGDLEGLPDLLLGPLGQRRHHHVLGRQTHAPVRRPTCFVDERVNQKFSSHCKKSKRRRTPTDGGREGAWT